MKIVIELDNLDQSAVIETANNTNQTPEQVLDTLKNIYLANLADDLNWVTEIARENELIGIENE